MRGSMFDPYREDIIKWCADGITCTEMIERLGGGYLRASLYEYIRHCGLREPKHYEKYIKRNKCDECEFCHEFRNWKGTMDKSNRICTKSWQVVNHDVVYSPTWCEKGGENGKYLRKL